MLEKNKININNKEYIFYTIPFAKRYGISKTGELYSYDTNTLKKWNLTKPPKKNIKNIKHGYYVTGLIFDMVGYKKITRHRLLMLVFKYKVNCEKLFVNHINGIPGDDRLENLEWVTPKENLQHAIDNGLMPNSVINIDIKNYITGKELSFNSIADAARYLKWSHSKLRHRLNKNNILYPDNIIIKRKNDNWPLKYTRVNMGVKQKVKVTHTLTGDITYHDNIMAASIYTKVNTTSISQSIRGIIKKPVKKYLFERYTDNVPILSN